jgi:hypothetical protein
VLQAISALYCAATVYYTAYYYYRREDWDWNWKLEVPALWNYYGAMGFMVFTSMGRVV